LGDHTCSVVEHDLLRLPLNGGCRLQHSGWDYCSLLDDFSANHIDFLDLVAWEFDFELVRSACL
jgi:hypothetical protein